MDYLSKLRQTDFVSRKIKRITGLDEPNQTRIDNWRHKTPLFNAPLVSVILPVYNHAEYITKAIQSVLSQDIAFELIIVDDGSTDDISGAVRSYLSDPRIHFYRKTNGGLASALNFGFKEAVAPFWTWTSADNLYLPGALQELAQTLVENPLTPLAYGNVELIDEKGKLLKESNYRLSDQIALNPHSGVLLNLPREGQTLFDLDDNFINSCFLYRRSFANLAGSYSKPLNGVEDYEYWLKLTAFVTPLHTKSSKALYQYRLHTNSLTGTLDSSLLCELTRKVRVRAKALKDLIDSEPLPKNLSNAVNSSSLFIPKEILRARDGDYRSLTEVAGQPNVGIIYNLGDKICLEKQIGFNISVYTLEEPYELSDLKLESIPLFNDHPLSYQPRSYGGLSAGDYRSRSLMFYLSRIDFLLIPGRNWSVKELRYKAGLAASGGVELRVLRNETLSEEDLEFLDLFLPAKHITFYNSLSEALSEELKFNLSREYFNKWAYSQSFSGISARVKTGIFSKTLEKDFS